jgi:hypothetical protein
MKIEKQLKTAVMRKIIWTRINASFKINGYIDAL